MAQPPPPSRARDSGRALARPLRASSRRALTFRGLADQRTDLLYLCASDNRNGRLTENKRRLATVGAHTVRPEHNLRTWARACRALKETCECGRAHRAPQGELARRGYTRLYPKKDLRLPAQPMCVQTETCDRGRAHRAPLKELAKWERTHTVRPGPNYMAILAPHTTTAILMSATGAAMPHLDKTTWQGRNYYAPEKNTTLRTCLKRPYGATITSATNYWTSQTARSRSRTRGRAHCAPTSD